WSTSSAPGDDGARSIRTWARRSALRRFTSPGDSGFPWPAMQRPRRGSSQTGDVPTEIGIDEGMIRLVGVAPSTVRVTDWAIFVPFLTSTGNGRRSGVQ